MKSNIFYRIGLACIMAASTLSLQAKDYQAVVFGAKSDGVTLNTRAIQRAIDHIAAEGGGRLIFTVGRYRTGAIRLKSNVTIHLGGGATLVASSSIYDMLNDDMPPALISAKGQKNIAITGSGVIEGNSDALISSCTDQIQKGYLQKKDVPAANYASARSDGKEGMVPAIVYLENCSEVNIKNFIIQNVPNTAVIFNNCKKVKMDKVNFFQLHGNLPIVNFNSTETSFNGVYVDDKTRKNTIVTTFTTSNNTK